MSSETQVQGSKRNIKQSGDDSLFKYGLHSVLCKDEKVVRLASAKSSVELVWNIYIIGDH